MSVRSEAVVCGNPSWFSGMNITGLLLSVVPLLFPLTLLPLLVFVLVLLKLLVLCPVSKGCGNP